MVAKKIAAVFFLCFGLLPIINPVNVAAANPWEIMINIPECQLYVYYNGWLFKTYKVAVGKLDSPSPTGEFRIVNKVIHPNQAHRKALACLIIPGKPLRIMIPRKIKIEADCINIDGDGFYWNSQVYLSEEFFRNNNFAIVLPNDHLFQGYLVWNPVSALRGERYKLNWDREKNIVSVNSFKLMINGEKIDGAARFGTKGQILINYLKISNWLDQKGLAKPGFVIATTEGNQFSGELIDGELWVDFETLTFQSTAFSYLWDEATWSLSIQLLNK